MVKELRSSFDQATVKSFDDNPIFDEAAVLALFQAIKPPPNAGEKLAHVVAELHEITVNFAFRLWQEQQPSVAAEAEQARKLLKACQQVLKIVGSGDAEPTADNILPLFGKNGLFVAARGRGEPSGQEATLSAIHGVLKLEQYASDFAAVTAKREANRRVAIIRPDGIPVRRRKEGRPESVAVKWLVADLGGLYAQTWERDARVALDPPNQFVRFMTYVAKATKVRLGNTFSSSAQSLAKVCQRLPSEEPEPAD